MKKGFKILIFLMAAFGLILLSHQAVNAQCAQCAANIATNKASGSSTADGLNHGIMYLLAAPYLAVAALGYVWYKKYRRKNVDLNMREEKLHLN
jgi:opacity protein-like surface antigen